MSKAVSIQAAGAQDVNDAHNKAVKSTHSPRPCPESALNTAAREWWSETVRSSGGRKPVASLQLPSDWPSDVVFLTQNLVAPSVPDAVARRYVLQPSTSGLPDDSTDAGPSTQPELPRATHNEGKPDTLYTTSIQEQVPLIIWPIDERTPWDPDCFHSTSRNLRCHPSVGSCGLFAGDEIASNTFIRPYLGVLHTKADADFHSTYDLSLCHDARMSSRNQATDGADAVTDELESLALDSEQPTEQSDPTALYVDSRYWGNESRFVNDYRGIAAKPNVEFRSFLQPQDGSHKFQMGLFSIRPIRKNQELVINYGKSYWIHHEQLAELDEQKSTKLAPQPQASEARPTEPSPVKLDPLQAMLQRSRMRVSRAAVNPQRPPHQPQPRSS